MNTVIWIFESSRKYGFVVPTNKKKFSGDFYISEKNTFEAKNWDLVEAEILPKNAWKNKEAKIIKILESKENNFSKNSETIVWIYSKARDKFFGFVDVEWLEKWYFVHDKNKLTARDWDKVEAILKDFNWKKEAEIVKILERRKGLVLWTFLKAKWNFWFVIPRDKTIWSDIFVAMTNSFWAKNWDFVWVEITKETWKNPEWVVREIIWKDLDKREKDVLALALEAGARIKFSEEIAKELEKFSEKISKKDFQNRKDLREIFTFTIDGEDAKDLDDAISLEQKENWDFILYVSIADVSNYVKEDSFLDKEALARATSIYLADRVIPMLPEKLSNNLCSLNPHTEKLTLTCEMHIWAKTWHTVKSEVYESVIKSDFRLTYREVDEIIAGKIKAWDELSFGWIVTEKLVKKVFLGDSLKKNILSHRERVWILNFEFPETYISFDEKGNVDWIKEYPKYNSNQLIEVFMVSANESVAKEFSKVPFLYRIHETPDFIDIAELQDKLHLFWVDFKFQKNTTSEFAELLKKFETLEHSKKVFLERMTLRTLSQAIYSSENLWHFWLGLDFYSHFTSPIRRYPDLQIHRIIKEILNLKFNSKRKNHYLNILPKVAKDSSERERIAEKLEYKVRDYFITKFYKNKVWQEFDAVISGVISKWFFVALPDTAEWFVELKNSIFDESLQAHNFHWKKFMLGQNVKVRLFEVDQELLRLNFELL